ncbi:MAG: alcohol dehydrogenase catalytic domain-containing protein [Gaiellales bacterium]
MRALVWTAPFEAEVQELPDVEAPSGSVVVEVIACGICGSDLHGFRGHSPGRVPPLVLGHELVGRVGQQMYVVNPLVGCGKCVLCLRGRPNLCGARGLLGLDRPGAFADMVVVPEENLVALPPGVDPVLGALTEPLATPLGALREVDLDGAAVLIAGCGPIGLLSAHVARHLGAALFAAFDLDPRRIAAGTSVLDLATTDPSEAAEAVRDAGAASGADVSIDAVGVEATLRTLIDATRPGGEVMVIGLGAAEVSVPLIDLVRRAVRVSGVFAYSPADFKAALDMLVEAPPPREWLFTVALEDGPGVLSSLAAGEDARVKLAFDLSL